MVEEWELPTGNNFGIKLRVHMRSVRCFIVVLGLMFLSATAAHSQDLDPRLANYDISGQLRFRDRTESEQRRETLVRSIWKSGLPSARPTVTDVPVSTDQISLIKSSLVSKAERYSVNVSGMDFESIVYVLHPSNRPEGKARVAIVHAGHMQEGIAGNFDLGLKDSIERLLESGFIVAAMQMPLVSWNKDATGTLPNGKSFEIKKRGTAGHDQMFELLEPDIGGLTMSFFLEPIVQVTNEFFARYPNHADLIMIGLSGGGWTTHFRRHLILGSRIPFPSRVPCHSMRVRSVGEVKGMRNRSTRRFSEKPTPTMTEYSTRPRGVVRGSKSSRWAR